ncbi:hypothetical protein KKG90_10145, partial [Candidatus Bipolaricaulota bacterium]|nr:hypothetical protein [Candidatus Bipolaricaulota bacterium]
LCKYFPEYNPAASFEDFLGAWDLNMDLDDLVCSGPWIVSEYLPGQSVTMTRNPYYYVYDSHGVQLPYYDQVVFMVVGNQDESAALFLNRTTDCLAPRAQDMESFGTLASQGDFSLANEGVAGYGTTWVMLNQDFGWWMGRHEEKRALYRELTFRQALTHGIDKQALIDRVYGGRAVPQWSPVSIPSPFYAGRDEYGGPITEIDAVTFAYDPALASQLLDGLRVIDQDGDGWRDLPSGDALTINLATNDNTDRIGCTELLMEAWRALGLRVNLRITEFNQLIDSVYASEFEMVLLGLTGGNEPDSAENIYSSCGNLHSFRYTACDDPTAFDRLVDTLLWGGATAMDPNLAFVHYKNYQTLVAEHLDLIYLVAQSFSYAYHNYVGNASLSSPTGTPGGANGIFTELVFDKRLMN